MIHGGHVDLAILGGLEVAANGDLANWTVPATIIAASAVRWISPPTRAGVVVLQSHASKDGECQLVAGTDPAADRARLRSRA